LFYVSLTIRYRLGFFSYADCSTDTAVVLYRVAQKCDVIVFDRHVFKTSK